MSTPDLSLASRAAIEAFLRGESEINIDSTLLALLDRAEAAEARRAEANNQWRLDYNELATKLAKAKEALEFYADPAIYKPHPHGLAFERRDLSFHARATLKEIGE